MKANYKILLIFLLVAGCREVKEIQKEEKTETTIRKIKEPTFKFKIASIELSEKSTRYSSKSILELADKIRNDNIDILTVRYVTRYPELKDRIDLLDELHKKTDMKYKFFEKQNNSGRLTGNAIFSVYPFISNKNSLLKLIPDGSGIDIGISNLFVCILSSNKIPNDIKNHINSIYQLIIGNFNQNQEKLIYDNNFYIHSERFLMKKDDQLKPIDTYSAELQLGKIVIVEFGIYQDIILD